MFKRTQKAAFIYVNDIDSSSLRACRIPARKLVSVTVEFTHAEAQYVAVHERGIHYYPPTIRVGSFHAELNDFNDALRMVRPKGWGLTFNEKHFVGLNNELYLPPFSRFTPKTMANFVDRIYGEQFKDVEIKKAKFRDVPKNLISGTGFNLADLTGVVTSW